MAIDWYRNTDWNEEIEQHFFEKLRRARHKAQYLRIQACTLSRSHPRVTLRLLERFFEIRDEEYDVVQAYVDQATAYETLGEIEQAISSYEKALDREVEFPYSLTQAYLELPSLIWEAKVDSRYEQALKVLNKHFDRPDFPVDQFRWHAIHAQISYKLGHTEAALAHAKQALVAGEKSHSGFAKHPKLGLVNANELETFQDFESKLRNIGKE